MMPWSYCRRLTPTYAPAPCIPRGSVHSRIDVHSRLAFTLDFLTHQRSANLYDALLDELEDDGTGHQEEVTDLADKPVGEDVDVDDDLDAELSVDLDLDIDPKAEDILS